jgi:cysteine desulfurase
LESTARLKREGFDVLLLPVRENGRVCLSALKDVLDERVALVSIMAVNNEIGVIQDLAEIGRLSRNVGAWFHTDAAQAFGKMEIDVESMSIDLLSISAHKIYGPKGIGALFIRGRKPKVTLDPLMDGGGQERGLRSGTLSPALCVGLGEAASVAGREYMQEAARLTQLRDALWHGLKAACPQLELNGDLENRLPGNLNFTVPGIEGEELLASLEGLSISAGSACASASGTSSHVLQALGRNPATIAAAVRIGLGRFTTRHEIEGARNMLVKAISKSDNLSCDY